MIRLSRSGARLLDAWLAGDPAPTTQESQALRSRLVDAGLLHPVPTVAGAAVSYAIAVPVYNDADGLRTLLRTVRAQCPDALIVVVDDASDDSEAVDEIAGRAGAELLRQSTNLGPAAARNAAWRYLQDRPSSPAAKLEAHDGSADETTDVTCGPEVVIFLDSDIVPAPHAITTLLAYFQETSVIAAAPRVQARPDVGALAAYEAHGSPLDLGDSAARVRPRTRISYVPSAALAVRLATLQELEGFDESMRLGEDVDFVWRCAQGEGHVRYVPSSVVYHRSRGSLRSLMKQRFGYGSSASALAARHRGDVAPIETSAQALAILIGASSGNRWARAGAMVGAAAGTWNLRKKLTGKVDDPLAESLRLTWLTHSNGIGSIAAAMRRAWLPLLIFAPRTRRLLRLALVLPPLLDWVRARPANDPVTHVGLAAVDDVSYCAGVWAGVLRHRSVAALLPRITR